MEDGREGSNECRYTLPGVLHFLQHDWSRFELERVQWDAEKAELTAKIAFLQGERRGQENIKRDLIRRIKMLEFALKKERIKGIFLKNFCEKFRLDFSEKISIIASRNSHLINFKNIKSTKTKRA